MKSLVFIVLLINAVPSLCDTMVQSDWSGDSGIWGPVMSWGNEFHSTLFLGGSQLELPLDTDVRVVSTLAKFPGYVTAGDIYTNGMTDLAFIDLGTDEVLWLENQGGGDFSGPYPVSEDCNWADKLLLCDLNGDGNQDIVGYTDDFHGIEWWENQLSHSEPWTNREILGSSHPHSVEAADIDGDGDLDLVAAEILEDLIWLENKNGSGTSWQSHTIIGGTYRISDTAIADMEGDGDLDIVATGYSSTGWFYWFENQDGAGTTWATHTVGSANYPHRVSAWDPDSDGDIDILSSQNMSWTNVKWWENLGSGYWECHDVYSGSNSASALVPCDIDLDGDEDFVLSRYSRPVMWFENTDGEGTMEGHEVVQPIEFPNYCSVADIHQDGYPDLIPTVYDFHGIFYCHLGFTGRLESSLLDTGSSGSWGMFAWESEPSPAGSVCMQVRSSSSPDSSLMGEWSEELTAPVNLGGILPEDDRYFQYRAILRTTDLGSSPSVSSVSVERFTGIGPGEVPAGLLVEPLVNPSPGSLDLRVLSETGGDLNIQVMDISGRIIRSITTDELPSGESSLAVEDLPSGVYIVVAKCSDQTVTTRATVIR